MEPRLSYVIGRLDRVLRRRLSAAVEPSGLTLPAYTALSVLRAQDGLSNARLARRSLVTPQSMSEVLAQLVEQGYVRRRAEPGHGRVIRIELTQAGSRALARCDRAVDEVEREMLGDLDADEAAGLRETLIRCGRALARSAPERRGERAAVVLDPRAVHRSGSATEEDGPRERAARRRRRRARDPRRRPGVPQPAYVGTRLRAPRKPLLLLPQRLSELTGPAFGTDDVARATATSPSSTTASRWASASSSAAACSARTAGPSAAR